MRSTASGPASQKMTRVRRQSVPPGPSREQQSLLRHRTVEAALDLDGPVDRAVQTNIDHWSIDRLRDGVRPRADNEGPHSLAVGQQAIGDQLGQGLAQRRPRDMEPLGELSFARQCVGTLKAAAVDLPSEGGGGLVGARRGRLRGRRPRSWPRVARSRPVRRRPVDEQDGAFKRIHHRRGQGVGTSGTR